MTKITTFFLAAVAVGNLIVSPASGARPIIMVTDDSELQTKKGVSFSGNHVPLSAEELDEMESLLTTFEQENNLRLEAGETGLFSFVVKTAWSCFSTRCWKDETGMLTGKKEKKAEVVVTSDQALEMEKFLDRVSQATISEDRDQRGRRNQWLGDRADGEEEMVAAATTAISPLFPDDSLVMAVESDAFEYVHGENTKVDKQPISSFNVPLNQEETIKFMGMLETFEKQNALLKENEQFWKLATYVVRSAVTCVARKCWRSDENDEELDVGELSGPRRTKKIQVELTSEQAVVLEEFMDEIGDKFIEENRAQAAAPGKQNLRGGEEIGEEFWGAVAAGVISGVFSLFRE